MGKNDLWIAACAKASGAILLTTDRPPSAARGMNALWSSTNVATRRSTV